MEYINELHYEDKPDYEFLRSLFTSSIQRLGYQDNDPYDWEKSIEHDETDSLVKLEPSQADEHKILQNQFRSPTSINTGSPVKHQKNTSKPTDNNQHLPLEQTHLVSPYSFDRIKLDSIGTGDQQPLIHRKLATQPENRSPPDVPTRRRRRTTHPNMIDRGQTTSNGLLTYVSQQYSNAAAPGTPSVFSQWSPHNGETLTDDDILKGNKSHSSRADERATTLSGERTPYTTTKNNPSDHQQEYYLTSNHQHSIEQNIQIPFGTYVGNTRTNNHYRRRQTPSPFRFSRKKI